MYEENKKCYFCTNGLRICMDLRKLASFLKPTFPSDAVKNVLQSNFKFKFK